MKKERHLLAILSLKKKFPEIYKLCEKIKVDAVVTEDDGSVLQSICTNCKNVFKKLQI